jgi:hypothetical protein
MNMRTKEVVLLALVCAISAILTSARGQEAVTTISQSGLFSYHIPPGWKVVTLPRLHNPISTDLQQDAPRPYIQIDSVSSLESLADFTAANKASLKSMVPNSEVIEENPFVTSAGIKGVRVVVKARPYNDDFQTIYYIFENSKNVKFIVMANSAAAAFEKNAPLFDAAIKTLVLQ